MPKRKWLRSGFLWAGVVLALLIVWGSYAVLVEGWRRVVLAMRQRLGYLDAVRITMVSNLGKYLPGKVWAIAGAALLAERAGVQPGAAVAAEDFKKLLSRHGLNLIVERVEDEKTVVQLLDYAVDYAQGFLFGEPRAVREEGVRPAAEGASVLPLRRARWRFLPALRSGAHAATPPR